MQPHFSAAFANGVAYKYEVIRSGLHDRIPEVVLMPGNRTLTAAGQANRARSHIRTRGGMLGEMA